MYKIGFFLIYPLLRSYFTAYNYDVGNTTNIKLEKKNL